MLETTLETLPAGRRLRVARIGSGPPLILLHGYPDNLQIFCRLARSLADDYEVVALDWPGLGASDAWTGGLSPAQMAERLIALMDHWGLDRADVAALDMGGQPALVAASRWPERIRRLTVMNSLVLWDERTSWEIAILRRYGWNRLILRHLPRLVFRRALRTFLPRGVRLPKELRDDLWRHFQRPEVRSNIVRMCAGYEGALQRLPEHYAKVRCPTLILWGERDRHFPPAHGRRLHELVPRSELVVLAGAEHWMAWYLAEDVARAVRAFAARH